MSGPTDHFRRHHAVDEPVIDGGSFRPFWRVRTRLDQLLIDRAITVAEWRAAITFRTIAETVLAASWRSPALDRSDRSEIGVAVAVANRLAAIERLHALRAALGGFAMTVLEAHVVRDEPWSVIAGRLNVHPKTARSWTVTVLKALGSTRIIWR